MASAGKERGSRLNEGGKVVTARVWYQPRKAEQQGRKEAYNVLETSKEEKKMKTNSKERKNGNRSQGSLGQYGRGRILKIQRTEINGPPENRTPPAKGLAT